MLSFTGRVVDLEEVALSAVTGFDSINFLLFPLGMDNLGTGTVCGLIVLKSRQFMHDYSPMEENI